MTFLTRHIMILVCVCRGRCCCTMFAASFHGQPTTDTYAFTQIHTICSTHHGPVGLASTEIQF